MTPKYCPEQSRDKKITGLNCKVVVGICSPLCPAISHFSSTSSVVVVTTLEQLFHCFNSFCAISPLQNKYGFEVSIVVHGVKIVYVPLLPGHSKRLDHK